MRRIIGMNSMSLIANNMLILDDSAKGLLSLVPYLLLLGFIIGYLARWLSEFTIIINI